MTSKFMANTVNSTEYANDERYRIIQTLYTLFGTFMALYRRINSPLVNGKDDPAKLENLLHAVIDAESEIDALILRISCQFAAQSSKNLESILGNLRQSVQIWRRSIEFEEDLPFYSSDAKDYRRFKESFVTIIVYLIHQAENSPESLNARMEESKALLNGAFDNKYES